MRKILSILFAFLLLVSVVNAAGWEKSKDNGYTWYFTQTVNTTSNYYPAIPIPDGCSHTMAYATIALYPYSADSAVDVDVTAYLATPIGKSSVQAERWVSSTGVAFTTGGSLGDSTAETKLITAAYATDSILVGSITRTEVTVLSQTLATALSQSHAWALSHSSVIDTFQVCTAVGDSLITLTGADTTTVTGNDTTTVTSADTTTITELRYAHVAPVFSHVRLLCDGQAANKVGSKVYITVRFVPISEFKLN